MILSFGEKRPDLGQRVFLAPSADIIGQVTLAEDASVFFQCVLRADINHITVGPRSNIQDQTTVHVASDLGTTIGADVSIGHGCTIHACTIGDRVLVGMGSIIMDGTVVGDDCLIAAGSLLPKGKTYEAGTLILGNPARAARKLTTEEIAGLAKLAAKYVHVKDVYLNARTWPG
ncbi:MAG TPA: gamma carbonic anhydrase family protein [Fibrobacteria bacterium]|nr:gamma carbonic anhydrase family protein [Fibrobacteria bacterium]